MANTPKVLIINAVTGEQELRDMNVEELAQWQVDKDSDAAKEAKAATEAIAKAALLAKLGITEDEAKLLLA